MMGIPVEVPWELVGTRSDPVDLPPGLSEEDYLDWLENVSRSPARSRTTDIVLLSACVGLASVIAVGLWMYRD